MSRGIKGDQRLPHQSLVDDGTRKAELKGEKRIMDSRLYKVVVRRVVQASEDLDGIRMWHRIPVEAALGKIGESARIHRGEKGTLFH